MPIHPFLFAVYIVVSMYANNAAQVPVGHMFRPLAFFLLLAGVIYWILFRLSKDLNYSAYAASWALLWLGLFGHLFQAVNLAFVAAGSVGNETITLIAWTLIMGFLGTPMAWRSIRNKKLVNDVLTAFAVGAAIFPVFTTANALFTNQRDIKFVQTWQLEQPEIHLEAGADSPDVYYIILDGYGRKDILQETYGFDNSEFLSALSKRGFYIADSSNSNYMQTALSLASSMNMEYVNFLADVDDDNRAPAYKLLESSRLRSALDEAGYETMDIASPVLFTQLTDFDQYHTPGNPFLTEFEKLILSVTTLAPLLRKGEIMLPGYESHRIYTLYSFDKLSELAGEPGPKFIFTHVVGPHPPFVFDAKGNPVQSNQPYVVNDATGFPGSQKNYIRGYAEQTQFINQLTLQAVDAILQNSARPPIIIIQGDHGPGGYTNLNIEEESCHRERGSILNAYYFPNQDYASLSPDVTPVNTFRIVFNQYFGTELPLLENHVYFSYWDDPYNFIEITDRLDEACIQ